MSSGPRRLKIMTCITQACDNSGMFTGTPVMVIDLGMQAGIQQAKW